MTEADQTRRYTGFDRMPLGAGWRAGSSQDTAADLDPYRGDALAEIPLANADDVDAAYRAARDAQREWAGAVPEERAQVFRRAAQIVDDRAEEIRWWLAVEAGSATTKAQWEWAVTRADLLEAASYPSRVAGRILPSQVPGKESRVYRGPVGVVGVISPWNFPLHLSNRSVAPALGVGNAVVLKPAGDTPITGGLLLAKIYEEAGLPAGVLNVIVGRGSEVGDPMVTHDIPRVLSFTGSTPVGRGIVEKARLKKLGLELGGNNPRRRPPTPPTRRASWCGAQRPACVQRRRHGLSAPPRVRPRVIGLPAYRDAAVVADPTRDSVSRSLLVAEPVSTTR